MGVGAGARRRRPPSGRPAVSPPAALGERVRRLIAPAPAGGRTVATAGPQALTLIAAALIAAQLAVLLWHLVPGAQKRPPAPSRPPPCPRRPASPTS